METVAISGPSVASVVSLYNSAGMLLGRNSTLAATALAVSPDGLMMVAGTTSAIKGLNQSGFEKWSYETYGNRQVLFSHDGSYIAAISADSVLVFNPSGGHLWYFQTNNSLAEIAISSDDAYIVAGSQDKKVYLLDRKGRLIWSREIGDPVSSVAISGDGSYIAAGSTFGLDKEIYLFNKKGDLVGTYKTEGWVMDVALSSDGSYLAAVANDGSLYYFRTESAALTPPTTATQTTAAGTELGNSDFRGNNCTLRSPRWQQVFQHRRSLQLHRPRSYPALNRRNRGKYLSSL